MPHLKNVVMSLYNKSLFFYQQIDHLQKKLEKGSKNGIARRRL